jgi:hypothetical protein
MIDHLRQFRFETHSQFPCLGGSKPNFFCGKFLFGCGFPRGGNAISYSTASDGPTEAAMQETLKNKT